MLAAQPSGGRRTSGEMRFHEKEDSVSRMRKSAVVVAKAGAIVALGAGAVLGMTGAASASGTGNTVNNCYGVYFTRDWNQECGAGGASVAGFYHSTADCTSSNDHNRDVQRAKGDARSIDGEDCLFQVINVRTTFS
jgi:hypothetical protein